MNLDKVCYRYGKKLMNPEVSIYYIKGGRMPIIKLTSIMVLFIYFSGRSNIDE